MLVCNNNKREKCHVRSFKPFEICRFCTFKLKSIEDTEISKLERQRIVKMMKYLPTTQKRSYTNPFDSHYAVLKTKIAEQPKDHKEIVQEWMLKNIRMNGLTEYQTAYDGKNII